MAENNHLGGELHVNRMRRKSVAVWQMNAPANNPYANVPSIGRARSRSRGNTAASNHLSAHSTLTSPFRASYLTDNNNNNNSKNNNFLAIPESRISYGDLNASKQQHRRMSIHVSARQHGRSFSQVSPVDISNLPPLPNIGGADAVELTIEQKIAREITEGSAAEIDDYYKTLLKQRDLIMRDVKENINQNQKNILQLTVDLKGTQEELMEMRGKTKVLYDVLAFFREAAQRRLDAEFQTDHGHGHEKKGNQLGLPSNKRKDRSSIMVLKKMWDEEMQSLFKNVDGASKYIQPLPGRHVVVESGRWFEVNVGNWKPNNPSHLFVLNDLILVAVKKSALQEAGHHLKSGNNNSNNSKGRLQAVQCSPLTQVTLQQIKPPKADEKLYYINLKTKKWSYVYLTDRYDHFVKITDAFNKGRNDMIQNQRLADSSLASPTQNGETNEEKRQLRESLRNSGSFKDGNGIVDDQGNRKSAGTPNRNSTDQVLHDISARVHSRNRSHDFGTVSKFATNTANGKSQFFNEIKTLEDRLDDVDVEISHNQYSEAVELISIIETKLRMIETALMNQKNNKNLNINDELLLLDVSKLKINNRKESVSNGLIFDLQHNVSKLKQEEIEMILTLFDSLNQLDRGVQAYLDSMSACLSSTVSKLIMGLQGSTKIDVVNYLSNLMVINVSIVRRTIQNYESIIAPILQRHGDVDSSGLINWCIDEFTKLCQQIKKHLYGTLLISAGVNPDTEETIYKVKDKKLYENFLEIMQPQLEDLKLVGLNVDYIFESILNIE